MPNLDNQTVQLALFALVALAMLVQAIVLLAAFLCRAQDWPRLLAIREIRAFRSSVMPLIDNTRDLVTRLAPKIEQTTQRPGRAHP